MVQKQHIDGVHRGQIPTQKLPIPYSRAERRKTVSFRISVAQNELLEDFSAYFKQGKGELVREAIQLWLNKMLDKHGQPKGGSGAIL